jgi:hypothetical protein
MRSGLQTTQMYTHAAAVLPHALPNLVTSPSGVHMLLGSMQQLVTKCELQYTTLHARQARLRTCGKYHAILPPNATSPNTA